MCTARLELQSYRRSFKQPLKTHHGLWCLREGILLRLTNADGRIGWGEIAPIAEFGTETMGQAVALCRALPCVIRAEQIEQIPPNFPACRFGLEAAWEMLTQPELPEAIAPEAPPFSYLLPTGAAALLAWQSLWTRGARTFKWKIGVEPLHQELSLFEHLITALPREAHLRLDANAGLDWNAACAWLQMADRYGLEFLEQPLPPDQFAEMVQLSDRYTTLIALDESVTTVEQMLHCHQQGWRGIFVVKAAIAGSPAKLRQACQTHALDVVWSSVFETAIARHYIFNFLIPSVPSSNRAIGFGVQDWLSQPELDQLSLEQVWQSLQAPNEIYSGCEI